MANKVKSRLMRESEIPAFVDAIIKTGCDICACGDDLYTIGDADLSDDDHEVAAPQLEAINAGFGDWDHLRLEIVAHLRSMGRYLDNPDIDHWSLSKPLQ